MKGSKIEFYNFYHYHFSITAADHNIFNNHKLYSVPNEWNDCTYPWKVCLLCCLSYCADEWNDVCVDKMNTKLLNFCLLDLNFSSWHKSKQGTSYHSSSTSYHVFRHFYVLEETQLTKHLCWCCNILVTWELRKYIHY